MPEYLGVLLRFGIFIFYVLLRSPCAFGEQSKITVAADHWCPYFCKAGQNFDGFSVEILREALRKEGFEMEYINASFARITFQVENGKWHIHGATDKNFTPSLLIGKEAVAYSKWVFAVKKGRNWSYTGTDSLKGMKFGAVSGYVYSDTLMDYYKKPEHKEYMLKLAAVTAQKQTLMMMMSGRIDFIVEDESVLRYWAKQLGLKDKIEISGVDSEVAFYPAYRKNDSTAANLADKVDKGINAVKKDKAFMSSLLNKYQIADWK